MILLYTQKLYTLLQVFSSFLISRFAATINTQFAGDSSNESNYSTSLSASLRPSLTNPPPPSSVKALEVIVLDTSKRWEINFPQAAKRQLFICPLPPPSRLMNSICVPIDLQIILISSINKVDEAKSFLDSFALKRFD